MKQILYFMGENCHQCKALKPRFEAEVNRLGFNNYVYINAEEDEGAAIASKYLIRSIPTLVFLDDEKEVGRAIGAMASESIKNFVR